MTTTDAPDLTFRLSPQHRRVFIGLIVGMLVASISQTIVGPAMPRIVSELGGMEYYSWVATAAMLVSAITVPIVGKLSDLCGRRGFFLAGLLIFMSGSILAGFAESFWVLVAARAVQGLGMGTIMPLSQTIIGDIIPPRQRGKYQGYMGAVFGLTSVAGPLVGGLITDAWGWRWLFFATLPVGVVAFILVFWFLRLPHQRRHAKVDVAGMLVLSSALVAILLATSWGGTTYPWLSPVILGLYAAGTVALIGFVFIELRAEEPVIPLRLFKLRAVSASNLAGFGLSMVMFGAIIYLPVFAQGVLGVNATNSGLILAPMMLSLVVMGIFTGQFISRTGSYKPIMVVGTVIMGVGVWLLTRLSYESSQTEMTLSMVVLGVGIGMAMQQYTLVIQNAVERRDLGVATASSQFFRNAGSTVGIALFGSVMSSGLGSAIMGHLPAEAASKMPAGGIDPGAVLDPEQLAGLPPVVADAVRHGLADQLHQVFVIALPIAGLVMLATLAIKALPLRSTSFVDELKRQEAEAAEEQPDIDAEDLADMDEGGEGSQLPADTPASAPQSRLPVG
ncbi:MAG: MDR family MFS transporter [Arachnia sp.]